MRRALVAALLTSLLSLVSVSAAAAAAPPEGVFEGCPLATQMGTCLQRLQVMHSGGVSVVVIPVGYTEPQYLDYYAAVAHNLGMSVMWEISDPNWWQSSLSSSSAVGDFSGFASACGCRQNGQLLSYMARHLGGLAGTYGYYAADDTMVSSGDGPAVKSYTAVIKAADPAHTVMIGSADQSQTDTFERAADVIGAEVYPVTGGSLMPAARHQDMWDSVTQTAIDSQNSANRAGKASAFILQAFTWGDNVWDGQAVGICSSHDTQASCYAKAHYPSQAEQLQLRNTVLAHSHPKLILWWSFPGTDGQVGNDTYSIYPTGAVAASRWRGLSAAIRAPWPAAKSRGRHAVTARLASLRRHAKKHKARRRRVTHRRRHVRRHAAKRHAKGKTHRQRSRRTHALAVMA